MYSKRFAIYCTFLLVSLSLIAFYGNTHWEPDPGPSLIEGNADNLTVESGSEGSFNWKEWEVDETVNDVKNKKSLTAEIIHSKIIDFDKTEVEGDAYCYAWSAEKIKCAFTKGKYEVHAQARGFFWYGSKKYKSKFFAGVTAAARKSAKRDKLFGRPTYSGVHLKGKSYIKSQAGEISLALNWL